MLEQNRSWFSQFNLQISPKISQISNNIQKLNDCSNTTTDTPKLSQLILSLSAFVLVSRSQHKNKQETLNNVLRRFANTTRKLLRKKIKANLPPTKENEVEWLVWALNALPRVCIMQLFIWSFLVVLHRSLDHFLGGKIHVNLRFYRRAVRLSGALSSDEFFLVLRLPRLFLCQ